MKKLQSIAVALFVFASLTMVAQKNKKVDVTKSSINWVGKKVTGQHSGTINLSEGTLAFKGEKLTGGTFTVDMPTITVTDLSGGSKASLEKHLKSDDFFGTENFKTATLVFKTITDKGNNVYTIKADLTIKGITNSITFDMTVGKDKATTTLMIDRTKYGVQYGSGSFFDNLGDKTIDDQFQLDVTLTF